MAETVKVYDIELEEKVYENLEEQIKKVDPSPNYSKKHIVKQACKLSLYFLERTYKDIDADLDSIKRRINDIENQLESGR